MKTEGEKDVLNYLGNIFLSGIDSDIGFIVKGEKIVGHRLILRDRSSVLNDLINRARVDTIYISDDTEPKVFRELLLYLYTGDAPNAEKDDLTEPLFIAARRYKVDSLKHFCSSILCSKLNKYSATNLLIFAHQNSVSLLKEKCIDFIAKNSAYFWGQDEFMKLKKTNLSLFSEITKRMDLVGENASSSKTRREFLSYEQIKEETKSRTLNSTAPSTVDETTTETYSQNDESDNEFTDNILERSNKKKSPPLISKNPTESSSGIDLCSDSSSITSAQTIDWASRAGAIPRNAAALVPASKPPSKSRDNSSSYSLSNDEQSQTLKKTTKKHTDLLRNGIGHQPVTTLPGIGKVYGSKLTAAGYYTVSQIFDVFLRMNKNRETFIGWLKQYKVRSDCAQNCYQALLDCSN